MSDDAILFEDVFEITKKNPDAQRFEGVNRYVCTGETYEVEVTVDFPRIGITLDEGEKIVMALASTLRLDGKPDDDVYQPNAGPSRLDNYELGLCGKVFRYDVNNDGTVSCFISFSGLLLMIKGEQRHLVRLRLDDKVYCLVRKISK